MSRLKDKVTKFKRSHCPIFSSVTSVEDYILNTSPTSLAKLTLTNLSTTLTNLTWITITIVEVKSLNEI